MRKVTLLLSALLLSFGAAVETQAQVVRAVKVTALSQLGNGSKVVIRNVGKAADRCGFVHEANGSDLLIDNSTTSLLGLEATYAFTISEWDNGACYLQAASGKKIAGAYTPEEETANTPMQTVDSPAGKVTFVAEAAGTTGIWDIKYGDGKYFNNQHNDANGPFVNTWKNADDDNASWEIYEVQMDGETAELTTFFTPESGAAYYIDCIGSNQGRASYAPGSTILGATADNQSLDLSNLFTITETTDAIGASGFHIRSYAAPNVYVYYINTNNADANVGVTTDASHANLVWNITTTRCTDAAAANSFNIIPATGVCGWNIRGNEPVWTRDAIGQWGTTNDGNNKINNCWRFVKVTEEEIAAAVEAYRPRYLTAKATIADNVTSVETQKIGYPSYAAMQAYLQLYNSSDPATVFSADNFFSGPMNIYLPTGYYRLSNQNDDQSGNQDQRTYGAYAFSDYAQTFGKHDGKTLANCADEATRAHNNYIWRITRNDESAPTIQILSGQGVGINNGTEYKELTIGVSDYWKQYYVYFTQGLHFTNQEQHTVNNQHNADATATLNNPFMMTKWAHTESKGSAYLVEPVDMSDLNVYNVVIEGAETAYVKLKTTNEVAINGGFFLVSTGTTLSENDLEAPEVEFHTSTLSVDNDNKTITVHYETLYAQQLRALITESEDAVSRTGVGYPTADNAVRGSLQQAIETAKQVTTPGEADVTALQTALTAYKSATTGIQMPEDGKAYTITGVGFQGNRYYMNYTGDGGYNVVATTETSNANYPESAKLICRKLENGKYVFTNNDGKYFIWRGTGTDDGHNSNKGYDNAYTSEWCDLIVDRLKVGDHTPKTADAMFGYMSIQGKRSSAPGGNNYFVIKTENGAVSYDQAGIPYFEANSATKFFSSALLIEETSYPNHPTLNSADGITGVDYIATFSAPFPTRVPTGVTAHYVSGTSEGETFKVNVWPLEQGKAIPANTGVLLTGTQGGQVTMAPATDEEAATIPDNLLHHTAGADKAVPAYERAYVLTKAGDKVAFYLLSATEADRIIGRNKAYLVLDGVQTQAVVSMRFGGESTDVRDLLTPETDSHAPVYDLTGRRVMQTVKGGIYIRNGRKFIVK